MESIIVDIVKEIVLGCILVVATLTITKKFNKVQSTIEDSEKLKELNRKTENDELKAEIQNVDKSLISMNKSLQSLIGDIEELKHHDIEQDRMIRNIANTNRINGQCTYELAQLVMVLSEGMRDQHLDGNITRAIDKYKKFENKTLGMLLTGEHNDDSI